jgi:succinate-acetate transporter protein
MSDEDRVTSTQVGERREVVRVMLRPIGHSLPLGFLGLAAATIVVSGLQLGWYEPQEGHNVAFVLIAFVFPVQLLAAVFGYLGRDSVAGTSMGILAGTWLTVGLITLNAPPGATTKALGTFLIIAAIAMLIPAVGASTGKLVPCLVLVTTSLRFFVTGLYELTGSSTWKSAAGTVGIVLCVFAVYAAMAIEVADVTGREPLPLLRRGKGALASRGTLDDQLAQIEHEPGVRQQL